MKSGAANSFSSSGRQSPTFTPMMNIDRTGLNETQVTTLKTFFEQYLEGAFSGFIKTAPQDYKRLRAFIILACQQAPTEVFVAYLNAHYPELHPDNPLYQQSQYFRAQLCTYNDLCHGKLDINHPVYALVFSNQLTDQSPDSPTKRNLTSKPMKQWTCELVSKTLNDESCGCLNLGDIQNDPHVVNFLSTMSKSTSVRKKLF